MPLCGDVDSGAFAGGNLAVAFVLPVMGGWYDHYGASAAFRYVAVAPGVLAITFGVLFFYYRAAGGYKAVRIEADV